MSLLSEVTCDSPDYRMWEVEQTYKANDALWRSELEQLESRLNRQLKVLTQKVFACKPDALDAVMAFQDSLELH